MPGNPYDPGLIRLPLASRRAATGFRVASGRRRAPVSTALLAVLAVSGLSGPDALHAAIYPLISVVTSCTGTCDSFAAFDVGATLVGEATVDTAPDTAWTGNDVTQFWFEFENPLAPPEPFDGSNVTTANPLPITPEFASVQGAGGGLTTGGTANALGRLTGTLLLRLEIPPFDTSDAWLIIEVGEGGAASIRLCTFFETAGCVPGATQAMSLAGEVEFLNDTPLLVTPLAADFGAVAVGTVAQGSVTVTNQSLFPADLGGVTVSPPGPFVVPAEVCSNRLLMPGLTCGVGLTFEPTTPGQATATLRIDYRDNVPDVVVPLSGLGFDPGIDSDADGVPDSADNCPQQANADQRDTDGDGIGNRCDADLTQDCLVNFGDLAALRLVFFGSDPDADFDGDSLVNFSDLALMKEAFFGPPGPGGTPNTCQ